MPQSYYNFTAHTTLFNEQSVFLNEIRELRLNNHSKASTYFKMSFNVKFAKMDVD